MGTFLILISLSLNAGVSTLINFARLYINPSNQKANLIINLFFKTPVSIADSGHKSLISKTYGILFIRDSKYPVIPTNKGGEVTIIRS